MAYSRYRRRRIPRRRYTRRYPRKVRRARRFTRSTRSRATFKSQGLPKELYVKFPYYWQPSGSYSVPISETLAGVIFGNTLCPTPSVTQPTTSSLPTAISSYQVAPNDQIVPGLIQYAGFYTSSCTLGSSLRLEFVFNSITDSPTITVVLLAVPYFDYLDMVAQITTLQAMNFNDLCSQPYAKCRILNVPSSGHEKTIFKSYRSVKSMLKIRDIKGMLNSSNSATHLGTSGSWQDTAYYSGTYEAAYVAPSMGFFWYYAVVTNSTTTGNAAQVFISAKMVVYSCLADRIPLPLVITSSAAKLSEANNVPKHDNFNHSFRRYSRKY